MNAARRAALLAIAAITAAASLVAFAHSYRGLYLWAVHHQIPPGWAAIWPLMIDTFVIVGELALFVSLASRWPARSRYWWWTVTIGGLCISIAANVGHVGRAPWTTQGTAAIPPVAAMISLTIALGVLKYMMGSEKTIAAVPETAPAPSPHTAILAAAGSDAARIRHAVKVTGSRDITDITAWLNDHGHTIAPANVISTLRRLGHENNGQHSVPSPN